MRHDEQLARWLNFLVRSYENVTKTKVEVINRLNSMPPHPEANPKLDDFYQPLELLKGRYAREIERWVSLWPIWERWLQYIPGIGAVIAAQLIVLYYYRFVPICSTCSTKLEKKEKSFWCPACEKSVKGDGRLQHTMEIKDFPSISKWWKYMGRAIEDGAMKKRRKGVQMDWSPKGRTLGYHIGEEFVKQTSSLYRPFYDERRKKREHTHPEDSKGHKYNMAKNETVKLFLSHFWVVARTIDGLPVTKPYIHEIGDPPHSHYIKPFYWDEAVEIKEAA